MHAVKGGWVGQTFAMAKCDDSSGRRSRIRRSKEERKTMIESFIKKYQKSNDGSFPSLNLTHKEVGGSFYTVRDIVREVIQENKVLGPATFTQEHEISDSLLQTYPVGPLSFEPETAVLSVDESLVATEVASDHHQDISKELVFNHTSQSSEPEHQIFDEGPIVNGSSNVMEQNEDDGKTSFLKTQSAEMRELEQNVELEAFNGKVTHVAEAVRVETFPLASSSGAEYDLEGKSSETSGLTESLTKQEMENVEMDASPEDAIVNMERSHDLGNGEAVVKTAESLLLEKSCESDDEKSTGNLEGPVLDKSNVFFGSEVPSLDTNDGLGLKDASVSNTKEDIDELKRIDGQSPPVTITGSPEQSASVKTSGAKDNHDDVHRTGSSSKGSNQTLGRINLSESWEMTKKAEKTEANPLLAFVKSFVTAFVKFWSE